MTYQRSHAIETINELYMYVYIWGGGDLNKGDTCSFIKMCLIFKRHGSPDVKLRPPKNRHTGSGECAMRMLYGERYLIA